MSLVVKLERDELKLVAEEIGLTVPRDAKMFYLKRLIEESGVFKEDYEFRENRDRASGRRNANNREISLNGCDTEMPINEDMELPQGTEEVLPLKSEGVHVFSVVPGAVAQTVTVGKKALPRTGVANLFGSTCQFF
ncbi:uncharacterized protein TNCV_3697381 [Trichonephila clavipes]|uniref:Uncharacterized protein n=1 Tax=Trichonephila clavipes TaxID=2585209 RepID=A0A8X6SAX4_TRICX|nr:uncharacterized protein TNCV_3697381 [Trichonephila clavipes]